MSGQRTLHDPYPLTAHLTLANRLIMAPMTRCFSGEQGIPTENMVRYYARRAAAGLIVTEGTIIRPDGRGYFGVPGIYNAKQVRGWSYVTKAVHEAGGKIFLQIWHVGRVSHPIFLNGSLPISPSATTMSSPVKRMKDLFYGESRALTVSEIEDLIEAYVFSATLALEAGFDGVEVHGANGYLIDQFLHHDTNKREDEFGSTPENMARFALEVVQRCIQRVGAGRVALRLSPVGYLNEIAEDPNDKYVFEYLLNQLNTMPLAYVHTGNFDDTKTYEVLNDLTMTAFLRKYYQGTLIGCGSYTPESAQHTLDQNLCDLIAFGRPFLANPNFVECLSQPHLMKPYEVHMLETLE